MLDSGLIRATEAKLLRRKIIPRCRLLDSRQSLRPAQRVLCLRARFCIVWTTKAGFMWSTTLHPLRRTLMLPSKVLNTAGGRELSETDSPAHTCIQALPHSSQIKADARAGLYNNAPVPTCTYAALNTK